MREASQPGEARRAAALLARDLGFEEQDAGRLALVVTEAASNLLKHSTQGEIVLTPMSLGTPTAIDVLALDRGPGMLDFERNLEDGFSTAGSQGTGLGAISRLADEFDVYSLPKVGTALWARVVKSAGVMIPAPCLEIAGVNVPIAGEDVSGDGWAAEARPGSHLLMVVDGLGHGPEAARAAEEALRVFREHAGKEPLRILEEAHTALLSMRGAAVAMAEIRAEAGKLIFTGIGNIRGFIATGDSTRSLASGNGTLGLQARHLHEFVYDWLPGSVLVLATDGLLSRLELRGYPGLIMRRPALIAGVLMRDFRRGTDDATVVVARKAAPHPVR